MLTSVDNQTFMRAKKKKKKKKKKKVDSAIWNSFKKN